MANPIVIVNVSVSIAPTPPTLQQMCAAISQGGTNLSQGNWALITQASSLIPLINGPAANTSLTYSGGTVTCTTTVAHGLPVGAVLLINIAGAAPSGYNGVQLCTVTTTTAFTYHSNVSLASETAPGTWQTYSAIQLTQMVTTWFGQGASTALYVLELGPGSVNTSVATLTTYLVNNPNSAYTPGAQGYFYSYISPREFDANAAYLALIASYESPTARTYFFTTTTLGTYTSYTQLMKCVFSLIESPNYGAWPVNLLTAISWAAANGGTVTATTTTAHGVLPGQTFTISGVTGDTGYNGTYVAQNGTAGSTIYYALATNPGASETTGQLNVSLYANAGVPNTEFSIAALAWNWAHYNPSTTNRVAPYAFKFIFGVTPFPSYGNSALTTTLENAFVNYVGTGAEGGISDAIILPGTTQDGQQANYWYSVDWVQINLDVSTANAVINGSNDPIAPLYYNQNGINQLQAVAVSVMNRGIIYGLVLGTVTITALDGPVLDQNLDTGLYTDQTVVNAVPFVTYSLENPSDYKIGRYAGLAIVYMPQTGFTQIIYNVLVTELISQ